MSDPNSDYIPFNRPYTSGAELDAISDAIARAHLAAGGYYTERCQDWLENDLGCERALLVHSCTAALELAALLLDVGPGDEVIMPSYTFVTTATAFAIRGATPVFVDIRPDTMNVDEELVASALTPSTRAIVPVHYAGVASAMEVIEQIANERQIAIVEDAAQGICASVKGRPLGTLGEIGAISFHETKNVTCGHGGALIINDDRFVERAEVLCDKGTNRSRFFRGEVDKYTWVDVGSSYAISDLAAAFLWPQLQASREITEHRLVLWGQYHEAFAESERAGILRRPIVPAGCHHNAHMYYLVFADENTRNHVMDELNRNGVNAVFHYVPLHSSPAGQRYGRAVGELPVTEEMSRRLLRLPLWNDMTPGLVERVAGAVTDALGKPRKPAFTRSPAAGQPSHAATG